MTTPAPAQEGKRAANGTRLPDEYRRGYLPEQLKAARHKVAMLEREAARLGVKVEVEG